MTFEHLFHLYIYVKDPRRYQKFVRIKFDFRIHFDTCGMFVQTTHIPVLTSSEKQATGAKSLLS